MLKLVAFLCSVALVCSVDMLPPLPVVFAPSERSMRFTPHQSVLRQPLTIGSDQLVMRPPLSTSVIRSDNVVMRPPTTISTDQVMVRPELPPPVMGSNQLVMQPPLQTQEIESDHFVVPTPQTTFIQGSSPYLNQDFDVVNIPAPLIKFDGENFEFIGADEAGEVLRSGLTNVHILRPDISNPEILRRVERADEI